MAQRIRAFDWAAHPLGTPETWPAALRTMVRMALLTRHPVFIFWGPQHLCLYNDAYSGSLGPEKHPGILGQPGRAVWTEIWDVIGPQIEQVLRGDGATWHENQLVPIIRNGGLEDVYWTYSYAPIHDDSVESGIGGVLVLCTETTEQVLTKQRLASERQRLASLFEQAPNFMTLLSGPQHVFSLVNPAYQRLIGDRDVIGKTVAEALPEAARQGYVAILDEVFESGRPFVANSAEYTGTRPGDPPRYLDFVYQPVTDEAGKVSGIFVVGTDVTERNRAQRALEVSEEQLRLATEAADVGLWDVDLVNGTLYWPARVKAMFGISAHHPVSMDDFYAGLHPDDRGRVAALFADAVDPDKRAIYDVEYRTVGREDGVVRWLHAKGRGIFQQGRCVRAVGSVLDITQKKRDEERIKQLADTLERRISEYLKERKLFADLVEGTDAFVQVSDLNFNWLAINNASADEFERIFGKRPAVGQNMLDLLEDMPMHQLAVRRVWARALAGEEFVDVQEFGDPGRGRRSYEMRFRALHDASGNRIGAYQFVYDVSDRRRSEERLAQAEAALHQAQKMEAVGQLTGGLAHDFNNLLQAIRTKFELLRRFPEKTDMVREYAERGVDVTKRAARLTTQLLTFSRQQALDVRPVALAPILQGMDELLRTTLGSQVTLSVQAVPQDCWVHVDSAQLEMAILNMGINARDAMPAGGALQVFVTGGSNDGLLDLRVRDTGLGMSEEVVRRAFDPFFTTKDIGKGSGLGLSQVYGMATQAGGAVRIDSTPGRGTTVIVSLRRAPPLDPDEVQEVQPLLGDNALKGSLLIIDDDREVREGLVASLKALDYEVVEAGSGEEGLGLLAQHAVDALLVDFGMPGMNGAEVARIAKTRRPDLEILFMSGYSDTAAISVAVGQDAVLLRKPFDIQTVHKGIQRMLQNRKATFSASQGAEDQP